MSSVSGFRGDVMAEGSRLQAMGAHYRDGGSGLSRDYCMDTQPLDYSTKTIHGVPLSLTSIESSVSLARDTSTISPYKQARMSPINASENSLPVRSDCPSPMSYSPGPHITSYSQMHVRSYSPTPPAYQPLLHPPPPPLVPPAAQISSSAHSPISSSFHTPPTVSSLLLAQLQANPLLFSTLLAKSNLMAQQQQLQKALASPPLKSPPRPEPRLPSFSGGSFGVGGVGAGALGMMHLKNYHGDQLGAASGALHNTTQEELVLMERSNEEYRNFRENFLTESTKMRGRRGGRRSSTTPGAFPITGNDCGRIIGAPDDSGGEGSIDVVSGDSGDGDDCDTKNDNNEEENSVEMDQQRVGLEICSLLAKKRNRQGAENALKDEAYWERRRRNNEAAKRSRDARRAKEEEIAIRGAFLEQENMKLRAELSTLKSETAKLRCMLYNT